MGAWGLNPFDNDDAAQLFQDIEESSISVIKKVIKRIANLSADEYIDIDDGCTCWAACELVALSLGNDSLDEYNFEIIDIVRKARNIKNVIDIAIIATKNITDKNRSELYQELTETNKDNKSKLDIDNLINRLSQEKRKLVYRMPKKGDIYFLESELRKNQYNIIQVLNKREIIVYENKYNIDSDLSVIKTSAKGKVVIAET